MINPKMHKAGIQMHPIIFGIGSTAHILLKVIVKLVTQLLYIVKIPKIDRKTNMNKYKS